MENSETKPIEFLPTKTLQEVQGYVSFWDGGKQYVLKVTTVVHKILKKGDDSQGLPAVSYGSSNAGVVLTIDEYKMEIEKAAPLVP